MIGERFKALFGMDASVEASAPGRVEFIGNHVDYNGGRVIGAAIDRYVCIAAAKRADRSIVMHSTFAEHPAAMPLDAIAPMDGKHRWANYILGVIHVLMATGRVPACGLSILVDSDLPQGAGLSSSAALELATARALEAIFGWTIERKDLVAVCRQAENEFVGVPCGILDQGVIAFGEENRLVCIDCDLNTFETLPMPRDGHFWIFNTNKKHELVDSLYARRSAECAQAFAVLQDGFPDLSALAQVAPDQLEKRREALGPELYSRARHVVEECARVAACAEALRKDDLVCTGHLLTASHESSRRLFMNSCDELDFLVEQLSLHSSVYGARLSGGGFGGAVMALTNQDFSEANARAVANDYEHRFGLAPTVFRVATGHGAQAMRRFPD